MAMNRERSRLTTYIETLKKTVEELGKAGEGGGEGDWWGNDLLLT